MESYERNNDIIGDGTLNCAQKIVGSFCEALGIPLAEGLRMARPLEACGQGRPAALWSAGSWCRALNTGLRRKIRRKPGPYATKKQQS